MDFDIRIPIGLLFLVLGALLAIHGFMAPQQLFDRFSLGININLAWGSAMALLGAFLLGLVFLIRGGSR